MRTRFLIIFLIFPLLSSAQTDMKNLPGFWVKVKASMKDGSHMIDRNGCGMDFLKCTFAANGMANMSTEPLFDYYYLPYKVVGDSLFMRRQIYDIISLTKHFKAFVLHAGCRR